MFYAYVDWTLEEISRPFYVGYGNDARIRNKHRNKHHTNIRSKYGMRREIVFETLDESLAKQREIQTIAEHRTYVFDPDYKFGCNYTTGGEGVSGLKFSSATLRRLSEVARRENLSFETRQKMSSSQRNKAPASLQTRLKMSLARKGKPFQPHNMMIRKFLLQQKAVQQFSLDGKFIVKYASLKEAYQMTKVSNISACCRHIRLHAGGYLWKFENERNHDNDV